MKGPLEVNSPELKLDQPERACASLLPGSAVGCKLGGGSGQINCGLEFCQTNARKLQNVAEDEGIRKKK